MSRLNRYMCSGFTTLLMAIIPAIEAQALGGDKLTVFAGPQSAVPGQVISITVQTDPHNQSGFGADQIVLRYNTDGKPVRLTGSPIHGLVSFDVKAQNRAGVMAFSAKALGQSSSESLVVVTAGLVQNIDLQIIPSREDAKIVIASDVITDAHGNSVTDQALIDLEWIDATGLIKQQNTQLLNGRLYVEANCPSKFLSPLRVRAVLKTVQAISADISTHCQSLRAKLRR